MTEEQLYKLIECAYILKDVPLKTIVLNDLIKEIESEFATVPEVQHQKKIGKCFYYPNGLIGISCCDNIEFGINTSFDKFLIGDPWESTVKIEDPLKSDVTSKDLLKLNWKSKYDVLKSKSRFYMLQMKSYIGEKITKKEKFFLADALKEYILIDKLGQDYSKIPKIYNLYTILYSLNIFFYKNGYNKWCDNSFKILNESNLKYIKEIFDKNYDNYKTNMIIKDAFCNNKITISNVSFIKILNNFNNLVYIIKKNVINRKDFQFLNNQHQVIKIVHTDNCAKNILKYIYHLFYDIDDKPLRKLFIDLGVIEEGFLPFEDIVESDFIDLILNYGFQ